MTYDTWHMTYDLRHMTYGIWHMTHDIWHIFFYFIAWVLLCTPVDGLSVFHMHDLLDRTVFMLNPLLEVGWKKTFWNELQGNGKEPHISKNMQTDIATYRQNWPMSQLFENDQILSWFFWFGTSLRSVNLYCVLCEGLPVNKSFISGLLSSVFQTWGNMMAWNNIIQEHN